MLRDRLKQIDLKITELSEYLQISRPTMYKFIESYESQNYSNINKKVLNLFNYINENELAGKRNVINYIFNHFVEIKQVENSKEVDVIKKIKNLILSNPDSKKSKLIKTIINSDKYDEILFYILEIDEIKNSKSIDDKDELKIKLYEEIIEKIKKISMLEE